MSSKPSRKRKSLVQLHIDAGQKNFHLTKCAICTLTYCKGQASDEKQHTAYHLNHLRGTSFQGWSTERVVSRDAAGGRILLVLQTDPQAHVQKVSEICSEVASRIGYAGERLLKERTKAFLYISPAKRVTGCLIVEQADQAYPVAQERSPPPPGAHGHPDAHPRCSAPAPAGSSQLLQLSPAVTDAPQRAQEHAEAARSVACGLNEAQENRAQLARMASAGQLSCAGSWGAAGGADARQHPQESTPGDQPLAAKRTPLPEACNGRTSCPAAAKDVTATGAARQRVAAKAAMGVRALWVAPELRRQGVASRLVDAARCNFVLGSVVRREDVAYHQPSHDCRCFGRAYSKCGTMLAYD